MGGWMVEPTGRWGSVCWQNLQNPPHLRGSLGMYRLSVLLMNHKREQNLKDSKTALNGWLLIPFEVISRLFFCTRRDWQIHLDSPSYHRFWNFGMSTCLHSFCQCVENGILSWDSKKDFDPELTTLFFATPARNERSKVLWHGVPQAQVRERKVVTWSEKRWEGKMSWDDELLLVFGINVYDTVYVWQFLISLVPI